MCYSNRNRLRRVGMKITTLEFKSKVDDLGRGGYKVLGEYLNSKTKVNFKHLKCGTIFSMTPNNFSNGQRCPSCFGTPKKTTEQFKKEVAEVVKGDYTVLGEYKNNKTKIRMRHEVCGYEYDVAPGNFLNQKARCPNCSKLKRKTTESFSKEVEVKTNGTVSLVGEYINASTKVRLKHSCGYEWEVYPSSFLYHAGRCPLCCGRVKKTPEEFRNEFTKLAGNDYSLLSEYSTSHKTIKIKHDTCGHIYEIKAYSFLQGRRCPLCANVGKSKGEDTILNYLKDNNIKFSYQYPIKSIECNWPLRMDFAILDDEDNIVAFIEYDGIQHFEPVKFNGISEGKALSQFEKTQYNDRLKDVYCKKEGIPLIRIPYNEFNNIKDILNNNKKVLLFNSIKS